MFDFRRITLFCFEKTLLKAQNDYIFLKFGGNGPFPTWLRLCADVIVKHLNCVSLRKSGKFALVARTINTFGSVLSRNLLALL